MRSTEVGFLRRSLCSTRFHRSLSETVEQKGDPAGNSEAVRSQNDFNLTSTLRELMRWS
ncbi:hypothetical protein [Crocosphaera watsonii]|uniref:hypothetical protein n=1 Tax=Crocosphaera watsonii TaxID=263511 RepID=UPI0012E0635D|nr:hypothetical protein [Crocosphaera watsonii]